MPVKIILPPDNRILFFERDREIFGFLSHFHPAPILLDGVLWPTAEHFYQSHKSLDPAYRQAVLDAPSPGAAKHLAADPRAPRKQARKSWFRKKNALPREDWPEVKLDVMRRADFAKFTQHENLRQMLLATGDAEIVEDSPHDPFWGVGPNGQGSNWTGRVLMEIRSQVSPAVDDDGGPVAVQSPGQTADYPFSSDVSLEQVCAVMNHRPER
jgi:ribA/ribD-fused uncharacterized protein